MIKVSDLISRTKNKARALFSDKGHLKANLKKFTNLPTMNVFNIYIRYDVKNYFYFDYKFVHFVKFDKSIKTLWSQKNKLLYDKVSLCRIIFSLLRILCFNKL